MITCTRLVQALHKWILLFILTWRPQEVGQCLFRLTKTPTSLRKSPVQ